MTDYVQPPPSDPADSPPTVEPEDLLVLTEDDSLAGGDYPRRPPTPRVDIQAFLFVATCASTYWVGGWLYALCLMTILLCHEAGHYIQARRHGVRASLPFFIPMPVQPIGTMGAVILMDPRTGDRKALFDIGITGPLAGLIPTLIFCVVGLSHSAPDFPQLSNQELGEPPIFTLLSRLLIGPVPEGKEILVGPVAMAGWVGLLITSLNLFPIGQLDGGHILYGLLRRRARPVATAILLAAIAAVVYFGMYWWLVMLFLLVLMGPAHPPTTDDRVPLGPFRTVLGWLTLAFLPLGFTPNPFPMQTGQAPPRSEDTEHDGYVRRGPGTVTPSGDPVKSLTMMVAPTRFPTGQATPLRAKEGLVTEPAKNPSESPNPGPGATGVPTGRGGAAAVPQPEPRVPMEIDESRLVASYSNFCRVTATPEEVILDFSLNSRPFEEPTAPLEVSQRIILNPITAKRLTYALEMSVERHEATFGVLETNVLRRLRPSGPDQPQQPAAPF